LGIRVIMQAYLVEALLDAAQNGTNPCDVL